MWPSSTQYMVDCLGLLQNVCSLGSGNVGFIQQPLFHQATSMAALMKHKHKLEITLLKHELDLTQNLCLTYSKDSCRQGSDKRPQIQNCMAPWYGKGSKWQESEAFQSGLLGPLNLLNVMDMKGYDHDTGARPGPAARLEQTLASKMSLKAALPGRGPSAIDPSSTAS